MKTIFTSFFTTIIIIVLGFFILKSKVNYVTEKQFKEAHYILNHKLDSLQNVLELTYDNTELINYKIDSLKNELTSLKKGQEIIYNEVKKENINFWDLF